MSWKTLFKWLWKKKIRANNQVNMADQKRTSTMSK